MRHHTQELIDELDSRGLDWSTHQLIVKQDQAIVVANNAAFIIDYSVTKNKDNTFTHDKDQPIYVTWQTTDNDENINKNQSITKGKTPNGEVLRITIVNENV